MTSSARFAIKGPPVIHETVDGEVIIVDLESGSYYSLVGVGAEIWGALERGASIGEAAAELEHRYETNSEDVADVVALFVQELAHENLVTTAASSENGDATAAAGSNGAAAAAARPAFQRPILNKYTDMQDLLLLDPIHEVDETGWPNRLGAAEQQDR